MGARDLLARAAEAGLLAQGSQSLRQIIVRVGSGIEKPEDLAGTGREHGVSLVGLDVEGPVAVVTGGAAVAGLRDCRS